MQSVVTMNKRVGPDIYVLGMQAPGIAETVLPGQFINIRVLDSFQPLLRRPFSVYRVSGDEIQIIFNIVGIGTGILHNKTKADILDIIGPLGCSFGTDDSYETAILVGGGMGVAPLPILCDHLKGKKKAVTFLGARSGDYLIPEYLENPFLATDDGSAGLKGTVVDLLRTELKPGRFPNPKIFACGPNRMLKGVSQFAAEADIPCELSLESVMGCGIGICQGCPVENSGGPKKYSLICKDGPVFNSKMISIVV